MKALVVYDSFFGNTEKIAQAIAAALGSPPDVTVLRVGNVKAEQLAGLDLLLVGSPTRGSQPSPAVRDLIKSIPVRGLQGVKVAAFDTRMPPSVVGSRIYGLFAKMFGFAANPIADRLVKKGGQLVIPPEGFVVKGGEGPLQEGEVERAAEWARKILAIYKEA